jgi:hypothetical protein
MQINSFVNGGYVIYKITGQFKGQMSAWFDRDGNLLDAEQTPEPFGNTRPAPEPFGNTRPVKRDGPMWQHAQTIGRRYKHIPVA